MVGRLGNAGIRHGMRAAAVGAAVAVVLGAVSCASGSSRPVSGASLAGAGRSLPRQLAFSSGSRAGWAAVPYRDAQLSVPGSWLVQAPQQLACGLPQTDGMIFAGASPRLPKGPGCSLTASLAWIVRAGNSRPGTGHRPPAAVIHGIPVYRLPSGNGSVQYLVPELGVRVGARGPLARRVLSTLTRSPLSVVLSPGGASPVPAGWSWTQSGSVRFATPPTWNLQRARRWATCGTGLASGTLLLIDATRPPLALPCPYRIPTASAGEAQPGLVVVTGKYAAQSLSQHYDRCQGRRGERICLSSVTGQGGPLSGVLIFSVSRPRQHAVTYFLLGLSGSRTARTIFGSISATQR
jgi:hypothetical protein